MQGCEQFVQRQHFDRRRLAAAERGREGQRFLAATTLVRLARARVVHQHLAHRPRGQGQQVVAVDRGELRATGELQVGLVDQRGGLEGVAHAPQLRARGALEFVVHRRIRRAQRLRIARAGAGEQLGDRCLIRSGNHRAFPGKRGVAAEFRTGRMGRKAASAIRYFSLR